jgi:hypothetical protein
MFKTLSIAAVLVGLAASLSAQVIDPDTFKVSYFANNSASPDNTVRITNVGTSGGNLCADIYVFDPAQELAECCSCRVTPDGLLTLSTYYNLTANTLTGVPLTTGDIKIVSSKTCDATKPSPASGVKAWATHVQDGGTYLTETEFTDSGMSAAELAGLAARCSAIHLDGSSKGICTCTSE